MSSKILKALLYLSVLLLTLSMSACTPGPYSFLGIDQVAAEKDIIYARTTQYCNYGTCENGAVIRTYYASHDEGQTWEQLDFPPKQMEEDNEANTDRHVSTCLIDTPKTCYRINEKEYVEASDDGGATWNVDWRVPAGRKRYMERYSSGTNVNIIPYDLKVIETGNEHLVVVAMGNQGILVRSADGVWHRYPVDTMVPIPYEAETLREALNALALFELPLMILIAAITLLLLTFAAWITFFVKSEWAVRRQMLLSLLPVLFALGLMAVYFTLPYLFKHIDVFQRIRYSPLAYFFFLLGKLYVIFSPLLTYVAIWVRMISFPSNTKFGLTSFLLSMVLPVFLGIFFLVPYVLWAFGAIPVYETAQTWAVCVGTFSLLLALFIEIRMAARSASTKSKEISI